MNKFIDSALVAGLILVVAAPAHAGVLPAPILGASISGLVTLLLAGGGYWILRMRRRNKD